MTELYKDKEWLKEQLLEHGNIYNVAKTSGYNRKTIAKYAKMFEIENPRLKSRKYSLNESFFHSIDTEEKAYWLGFFMADGCLYHHKTSYDIQFSLKIDELSHLQKFAQAIDSDNLPEEKTQGEKTIAFFRISSKRMFKDLERHGCKQNKTGEEIFPSIPKELKRHFIRGYFDGDGCISYYDVEDPYTFNIVCANESFLREIASVIKKDTGVELIPYQVKDNAYILTSVAKRKNHSIYSYLYEDAEVFLDRKAERVHTFLSRYSPL